MIVVEGQFRLGGWLTLLGDELVGKERLRESTPILLPTPTPYPFLSALSLGGYEILVPLPKSPGSMTTVSTRAEGQEFTSEREQGVLQRVALCGELSPSMLLVLPPKQTDLLLPGSLLPVSFRVIDRLP